MTDSFIICSGSSDTNVRAIADAVREKLKEAGVKPFGVEGYREGTWILMDYIDFVFHIFHFEKRLDLRPGGSLEGRPPAAHRRRRVTAATEGP